MSHDVGSFAVRNEIPALSGAAGMTYFREEVMSDWDMNLYGKPDGGTWGRDDEDYGKRWLHSDLRKMAFIYTHKLFKKLVETGELE